MECIRNNPVSFHIYGRPPIPPTIAHFFFFGTNERRRRNRSSRSSLCTLETRFFGRVGDGQWDMHIGWRWEITHMVGFAVYMYRIQRDWLCDGATAPPCRARSSTRNPLIKVARGAFCRPPWQLPNVSIYLFFSLLIPRDTWQPLLAASPTSVGGLSLYIYCGGGKELGRKNAGGAKMSGTISPSST